MLQAVLASSLIGFSGILPFLFASRVDVSHGKLLILVKKVSNKLFQIRAGWNFCWHLELVPCWGMHFFIYYQKLSAVQNGHWGEKKTKSRVLMIFRVIAGYLFGVVVQKMNLFSEDVRVQGAYINLMANCLDNFTHGLAIGGSFLIDNKSGWSTTACILIHEVFSFF